MIASVKTWSLAEHMPLGILCLLMRFLSAKFAQPEIGMRFK